MTDSTATNSTATNSTAKTNVNDESLFDESYQRVLPELEALTAEECLDVNLDIPMAISTVLGVLPQLVALRADLVKDLPNFDVARFDRLEDYCMALSYANARHATAMRSPDGLAGLNDEGLKLRATLQSDIAALVGRGLIPAAATKNYSSLTGPRNIAADLQIQAHVLKDNWERVEGKCATTLAEVDRALKVAAHLLRLAGLREQSPAVLADATEMRLRAFTVFSRAYDDARRAVLFLRWHEDDADSIAPSLYAGRGGSRKRSATEPSPAASASNTSAAVASATSGAATAAPNAAQPAGSGASAPGAAPANPFLT